MLHCTLLLRTTPEVETFLMLSLHVVNIAVYLMIAFFHVYVKHLDVSEEDTAPPSG